MVLPTKTQGSVFEYTSPVNTSEIPAHATRVTFKNFNFGTVPTAAFSNLSACTHIIFTSTNISLIEPDAWLGLANLEGLTMRFNNFPTLPADSFKHLTALTNLDFSDNGVMAIEPGAFRDLESLVTLSLNRNNLNGTNFKAVDAEVWADVSDSVTRLELYENGLTTVYEDMFNQFSSVTFLYLASNNITLFEPGAFRGLHSLQRLYLYNQKLNETTIAVNNLAVWGDISGYIYQPCHCP